MTEWQPVDSLIILTIAVLFGFVIGLAAKLPSDRVRDPAPDQHWVRTTIIRADAGAPR